jgi:hypothetical protein
MKKKMGKKLYEPPYVKDLSSWSVSGQDSPLGICENGSSPISYTCADGSVPTQSDVCTPTGTLPTRGRCSQGGNAAEGCAAGSFVTDCVTGTAFT